MSNNSDIKPKDTMTSPKYTVLPPHLRVKAGTSQSDTKDAAVMPKYVPPHKRGETTTTTPDQTAGTQFSTALALRDTPAPKSIPTPKGAPAGSGPKRFPARKSKPNPKRLEALKNPSAPVAAWNQAQFDLPKQHAAEIERCTLEKQGAPPTPAPAPTPQHTFKETFKKRKAGGSWAKPEYEEKAFTVHDAAGSRVVEALPGKEDSKVKMEEDGCKLGQACGRRRGWL